MKLLRPIHRDLPNINLVPWRERQRRTRWRRGLQLFSALGILLSAGMLVLLVQQLAAHSDLKALLSEVEQQQRPEPGDYTQTQQQALALYQQQQALDQLRQHLATLSSAMPLDVALAEVSLQPNELTLSGGAQQIQSITHVQNLLQQNTQARVVLEQVEATQTSPSHRFRIRIPIETNMHRDGGSP